MRIEAARDAHVREASYTFAPFKPRTETRTR